MGQPNNDLQRQPESGKGEILVWRRRLELHSQLCLRASCLSLLAAATAAVV